MNTQEQIQEILETYGGETSYKSINILLEDPALSKLKPYIEFISKNWRDPFVPALMHLSCKSVNGDPRQTEESAVTVSLINLSLRILDDVIDKTRSRKFRKTFVGKFGEANAIVVGNIISAKAFSIFNQANFNSDKKQIISESIWLYLAKMASVEVKITPIKEETTSKDKLDKIRDETINVQTCLKIGAIIGEGSIQTMDKLVRYGECFGMLLEFQKDIQASLNLTLELTDKIRINSLPFLILKAKEASSDIEKEIELLKNKQINADQIGNLVGMVLDSQAVPQIKTMIGQLKTDGLKSLEEIEKNKEKEKLRLLIEAQEQIITDLLS